MAGHPTFELFNACFEATDREGKYAANILRGQSP